MGHDVSITRNWTGNRKEDIIDGVRFLNVNCFNSIEQGFNDSKLPLNHLSHADYFARAAKIITKNDIDILNVSRIFSGWFALKYIRSHGIHCVYITHDNDVFVTGGLGHNRLPFISRLVLNDVNRKYDATVCTTVGIKNYIEKLGMHCNAVIPEAIDHKKYSPGKEEGFILTAARLVPHKRLEDLIKAFSIISDQVSEDLIIIGSGPCKVSLERYITSLPCKNRIKIIPFLPKSQYRSYLSKCSVFVLPSVAEAFGVVIIEAMASGKPVVVRNLMGPRDIVTHGANGFLFNNTAELAHYLLLLLSNDLLRKQLGKKALQAVNQQFNFEVMTKNYLRLYQSIVGV